jgi:hypothetical protein
MGADCQRSRKGFMKVINPLIEVMGPGQMDMDDFLFIQLVSEYGWYIAANSFWNSPLEIWVTAHYIGSIKF